MSTMKITDNGDLFFKDKISDSKTSLEVETVFLHLKKGR